MAHSVTQFFFGLKPNYCFISYAYAMAHSFF